MSNTAMTSASLKILHLGDHACAFIMEGSYRVCFVAYWNECSCEGVLEHLVRTLLGRHTCAMIA